MAAAVLFAALLTLPALASGAIPPIAEGRRVGIAEDAWAVRVQTDLAQVERTVTHEAGPGVVELRVPIGARDVQAFVPEAGAYRDVPWVWLSADRIAARVEGNGSSAPAILLVLFRVPAGPTGLSLDLTPAQPTTMLRFAATLPEGWQARIVDGAPLALAGGTWSATWTNPTADPRLAVSLAQDVGPSPLLVLGALTLLILVGSLVRSRTARGKEPKPDMGLLDHLHELQARLRVVLLAVALLMLLLFTVELVPVTVAGLPLAVPMPSLTDNIAAQTFRLVSQQFVPPGVELVVVDPLSGAVVQVEVALFLALLVASPLIAYEAGAFLMPALTRRERRTLLQAIPAATGLFVTGAAFAYFLMVPTMMRVLYSYAQGLGARPFLAVDSLVSFAIIVTLIFGIAFELPVFMVALAKLDLVSPATMAAKWRHVIVGIFVLAAVITPDPTIVSQLMVALPLMVLYGVGIVASRAAVKQPSTAKAALSPS
jgi:sec-independent protein translocase protein TatC